MTHTRTPETAGELAELPDYVDRAMPDHIGEHTPDPICPGCGQVRETVRRSSGRYIVIDCEACTAVDAEARLVGWKLGAIETWRASPRLDIGDTHWTRRGVEMLGCLEDVLEGSRSDRCAAYLYGPPGTGKSQQACELLRAYLSRRLDRYAPFDADRFGWEAPPLPSAVRVSEPGMLRSLRPNGGAELERYTDADLLVIDDLGVAKTSEWAAEKIWEVLDARWSKSRRTVITSNVTPTELMADPSNGYDERILRRIFDMCGGYAARDDRSLAWVHLKHSYSFDGGL